MFETGLTDSITIKKYADDGETDAGNPKKTSSTLIENDRCRVVSKESAKRDETGHVVIVNYRTVKVNYSGSDLTPECTAIINGTQEEIDKVIPARGFGRDFYEIRLKDRNE